MYCVFHIICFLHGCQVISLKPILFFWSHPLIAPSPPSHPHIHKQPVKVKRKKSFNLSRKFPFYKSKENIAQELEPEREYQLCDRGWGGGVDVFRLFPLHASVLSLSFHLSAHLQGWFVWWRHSHPFLTVPERSQHHQAGDVGFSLVCLCICLWAPEECLAVCVCKFLAALTHEPSNTAASAMSPDQFSSQSLTHNNKNLINWTEALTLNRSKSHLMGLGLGLCNWKAVERWLNECHSTMWQQA